MLEPDLPLHSVRGLGLIAHSCFYRFNCVMLIVAFNRLFLVY